MGVKKGAFGADLLMGATGAMFAEFDQSINCSLPLAT